MSGQSATNVSVHMIRDDVANFPHFELPAGMFRNGVKPLGYLLAGPLAERIFEPAMQNGGAWVTYLGWLVGTGPGAGIGAMFLCTALAGALFSASGYLFRATRNVEDDLPDHDEQDVETTVQLPVVATVSPVSPVSNN